MNYQLSSSNTKFAQAMTPEQFNEIVGAILDGKYSWACVLILRSAGYNPLHYIPYRTYNRLMKDRCRRSDGDKDKSYSQAKKQNSTTIFKTPASQNSSQKISALVTQA